MPVGTSLLLLPVRGCDTPVGGSGGYRPGCIATARPASKVPSATTTLKAVPADTG